MADPVEIVVDEGFEGVVDREGITRRNTARELAAVFRAAEDDVRRAFAAIVEAERRVNALFTLGGDQPIRVDASGYGYNDDFTKPEVAINRMRRRAWEVLCERLELRKLMAIDRWEKLQKQIGDDRSKAPVPELSDENIAAFVEQNVVGLSAMIAEAVREVYEWLRPRSRQKDTPGRYKTNSLLEIGSRVVLTRILDAGPYATWYRVGGCDEKQRLACLERVFLHLDGKGSTNKPYYSELQTAIESPECSRTGTFATPYFSGRCWRNSNLHLHFTRPDLLRRFNAIAGGKRLRPEAASA